MIITITGVFYSEKTAQVLAAIMLSNNGNKQAVRGCLLFLAVSCSAAACTSLLDLDLS